MLLLRLIVVFANLVSEMIDELLIEVPGRFGWN
jgi:hypothetical protein